MITASQCRAGRALIEWTEDQLAEAARVSVRTIADFEHERNLPPMTSLQAIEAALLGAGMALVDGGTAGVGVRHSQKRRVGDGPSAGGRPGGDDRHRR